MTVRKQLDEQVRELWRKYLPVMQSRLSILKSATDALQHGSLDEALRIEASIEAHKLSGSLGTFGLQAGSDIAREMETELVRSIGELNAARLTRLVAQLSNEIEQAEDRAANE